MNNDDKYTVFLSIPKTIYESEKAAKIYEYLKEIFPNLLCPGIPPIPLGLPMNKYFDLVQWCDNVTLVENQGFIPLGGYSYAMLAFVRGCSVSVIRQYGKSFKIHPIRPQSIEISNHNDIAFRYAKITKIH